jgi:hypothetical protein
VLCAGRPERPPRPGHEQDPCEQEADADERQRREAFLQEDDPDDDRDEGRAPACERVHEREGPAAVRRGQQDEVGGFKEARDQREPDGGR